MLDVVALYAHTHMCLTNSKVVSWVILHIVGENEIFSVFSVFRMYVSSFERNSLMELKKNRSKEYSTCLKDFSKLKPNYKIDSDT